MQSEHYGGPKKPAMPVEQACCKYLHLIPDFSSNFCTMCKWAWPMLSPVYNWHHRLPRRQWLLLQINNCTRSLLTLSLTCQHFSVVLSCIGRYANAYELHPRCIYYYVWYICSGLKEVLSSTSSQELNLEQVLSCELAAYPPSMFIPDGMMRIRKSKSIMKNLMHVTISGRISSTLSLDILVIDVSVLLWTLNWPQSHLPLKVFIDTFRAHVSNAHRKSDVTLVFDRCYPSSTKASTRLQRAGSSCILLQLVCHLHPNMQCCPTQKAKFRWTKCWQIPFFIQLSMCAIPKITLSACLGVRVRGSYWGGETCKNQLMQRGNEDFLFLFGIDE
jgi:hypothetical protein